MFISFDLGERPQGLSDTFVMLYLTMIKNTYCRSSELREVRANATNIKEYVDSLVADPLIARKSLEFWQEVYKVTLNDGQKLLVRRSTPYRINYFRKFYIWIQEQGFWWLVKHNTRNAAVASSVEQASLADIYLKVCDHGSRCYGLQVIISKALKTYIENADPPLKPCEQKIPMMNLSWEDRNFATVLYEVGTVLPWEQYSIIITVRHDAGIIVSLDITLKGLIKLLRDRAKYEFARIRRLAGERLRNLATEESSSEEEWENMDWNENNRTETLNTSGDEKTVDVQQLLQEYARQSFQQGKNVAIKLTECLARVARRPIQVALHDSVVILTSAFERRVKKLGEVRKALAAQVLASKLGNIDLRCFEYNKGFAEFAAQNSLHRYLYVHGHELVVDANTIFIMFEGQHRPWNEIRPLIRYAEPGSSVLAGQYSRFGIINKGVYEWTSLEPFLISPSPPPWGNRYLLEICSWIIDRPRLTGDHTWFRLKTPRGEWYSVGQYRPSKGLHGTVRVSDEDKGQQVHVPGRVADFSQEFWRGNYTVIAVEISEEEFLRMKRKIELDQLAKEHTYQVFQRNCVLYAKEVALLADIDFPISTPIIRLLVRDEELLERSRRVLNNPHTPRWVRPLLTRVWAILFNTFGLLWGSGVIDREIREDPRLRDVEPFIRNFRDLSNPERVVAYHPFILGHYVRNEVEGWRSEKISKLHVERETLVLEQHGEPSSTERERLARRIEDIDKNLKKLAEERVDWYLDEMEAITRKRVSIPTLWRSLKYCGITRKKICAYSYAGTRARSMVIFVRGKRIRPLMGSLPLRLSREATIKRSLKSLKVTIASGAQSK
ncbi:3402_t:CDS:10 [Paraglomus occultum]|uniref:3402_t:CDS:1 n=1 Tax=Paraglomus occultum TaxID=144539 RepID=A0A9N9B084_9GLOM|nr:3402_t:CDS:10 [Paraglomus occultum]